MYYHSLGGSFFAISKYQDLPGPIKTKEHIKITKQVLKSGIFHTGTRLPNKYREDLYLILHKVLPKNINTFHLVNSGSEAVETALKVVQYVTKKTGAISFTGGYHGRTIGALSVTHDKKLEKVFKH